MPFVTVQTNAKLKDKNLMQNIAETAASFLNKPTEKMYVCFQDNQHAYHKGEDTAFIVVESVGFNSQADKLVETLSNMVAEDLNIPLENVHMKLVVLQKSEVAHGGKLLG